MPLSGAINRCFADLENKGVVPTRQIKLLPETGTQCGFGRSISFDIKSLAADFLAIERLIYENVGGELDAHAPYRLEGERLILPVFDEKNEEYRLCYYTMIERIRFSTLSNTEKDIPDSIAQYIPYFIKSEMFVTDEPSEAAKRTRSECTVRDLVEITRLDTRVCPRVEEINQLVIIHQQAATDYRAIKYAEGVLSDEEYAPDKAQRQAWRERIGELEKMTV